MCGCHLPVGALSPGPAINRCAGGWILFHDVCYRVLNAVVVSWQKYFSVCSSLDAHMLCIPDDATNIFICFLVPTNYHVWLSFKDLASEGIWDPTCSSTNTHWNIGEPNDCNGSGSKECATMHRSGSLQYTWDDRFCETDSVMSLVDVKCR